MKTNHIFEVVDASSEETYYQLGFYLDEGEALAQLDKSSPQFSDFLRDEDSIVIEVRKIALGWHPYEYSTIARRTWYRELDEATPHTGK